MALHPSSHRTAPRRRSRAVVDPRPDVDVGSETAADEPAGTARARPTRPVVGVSPRRATAKVDRRTDVL